MIVDLSQNSNGMLACMSMNMGSYIDHDQIALQLQNDNISQQQRNFYQSQMGVAEYMVEYVETKAQEQVLQPEAIYPIMFNDYLPNASERMQNYIMAHPLTLERKLGQCDIYGDDALTGNSTVIGNGNILYDRVTSGLFSNDEDCKVNVRCTEVDNIIPPLSTDQQQHIQSTWRMLDTLNDLDDSSFTDVFEDLEYE